VSRERGCVEGSVTSGNGGRNEPSQDITRSRSGERRGARRNDAKRAIRVGDESSWTFQENHASRRAGELANVVDSIDAHGAAAQAFELSGVRGQYP
jgi:hypothetical protein